MTANVSGSFVVASLVVLRTIDSVSIDWPVLLGVDARHRLESAAAASEGVVASCGGDDVGLLLGEGLGVYGADGADGDGHRLDDDLRVLVRVIVHVVVVHMLLHDGLLLRARRRGGDFVVARPVVFVSVRAFTSVTWGFSDVVLCIESIVETVALGILVVGDLSVFFGESWSYVTAIAHPLRWCFDGAGLVLRHRFGCSVCSRGSTDWNGGDGLSYRRDVDRLRVDQFIGRDVGSFFLDILIVALKIRKFT